MPADEDREKATHWNEVLRGRARATLGDRKTRQVQVSLSVGSGRYLLGVGRNLPH